MAAGVCACAVDSNIRNIRNNNYSYFVLYNYVVASSTRTRTILLSVHVCTGTDIHALV